MEGDGEIFILSVDGVHCSMYKPKHPTYSKNPEFYSYKFKKAALAYEICLSICASKALWAKVM